MGMLGARHADMPRDLVGSESDMLRDLWRVSGWQDVWGGWVCWVPTTLTRCGTSWRVSGWPEV